jgi:D-alanine transaminase
MPRISYVNGRYLPHQRAAVHIEDRGYQFADGVYEVIAVSGGALVDIDPHLARLARSLKELGIAAPTGDRGLRHIIAEVMRRNRVTDGMVYLQITRGIASRDHAWPHGLRPSLVVNAKSTQGPPEQIRKRGCAVISQPDIRWQRRDIKSISLLPNVLAKQAARNAGAYETLMLDAEGRITEGSSTNVWIVTKKDRLVTRTPDGAILDGITRRAVIELARVAGLAFDERPFSLREAKGAAEVFLTSTTAFVVPVVKIDGVLVGSGKPGPFTKRLGQDYRDYVGRAALDPERRRP